VEFGSLSEKAMVEPADKPVAVVVLTSPKAPAPIPAPAPPAPVSPTNLAPRSTAIRRPRVFSQPAPDAVDPFAEEFEEEELVLDSFATLASIFGPRIPRVENSREPGLSRLVQNALDATSAVAEAEIATIESEVDDALDVELESPRGMIRLAVVNDTPSAADENQFVAERESADSLALAAAAHSSFEPDTSDDTILVIEDDPAPPMEPQPGVRRESYRQLFSRLRHGT
jgi:hypothetical protein